ncbi:MAG TPA: nucleoid-associated protein [Acidobacteriaceae bacterium]|nr:nucleoid-associated protein [Acidobacteriaceae bacterium]
MPIENLTISRIVAHEVFRRNDDKTLIPPSYGAALTALENNAMDVLSARINKAMSSASKSMDMRIAKSDAGSAFALAKDLIEEGLADTDFVERSRHGADLLAEAQASRQLPGGILVVVQGKVGHPARDMVAFLKAEVQEGFQKKLVENGGITMEFINDLFLTPEAKLFKIGLFAAPANHEATAIQWMATVYDATMTGKNRNTAAHYFYNGFLGCDFPENAAKFTKDFHNLSRAFINQLDLPEEEKSDLHNALVTYLKVDKSPTIQVADFADTYMPTAELKDAFAAYMEEAEFTMQPVQKDISDVSSLLRYRRVVFRHDIKLTAPAESFGSLITMETVEGDPTEDGNAPVWTKIIVKDQIQQQS